MRTPAAVLVATGKPLVLVDDLEIPPLQPGQALVEVAFSGVCHTQVLECRGYRGEDRYLPHCLGHEGSGTIMEVGPGVNKAKAGDRVILSWIKGSGADVPGTVYKWNGRDVNAGGITTFSRLAVVSENRVTPVPAGLADRDAALLGCAVPTGMGSVFNTARPQAGESVAVFGTGGVGLCAVAASAVAGCQPIIAVDILEDKLDLATTMGASHSVNADAADPVEEVRRICRDGVDFAIEASGRPAVMAQALESVRNQGGTVVVIGNARHGEILELNPQQLNLGKRLLGTWGGDSRPDRDYPRYAELVVSGNVPVESMISRSYSLAQINDAIDDLETGQAVRPLIDMTRE